jgi:hypothetical protein
MNDSGSFDDLQDSERYQLFTSISKSDTFKLFLSAKGLSNIPRQENRNDFAFTVMHHNMNFLLRHPIPDISFMIFCRLVEGMSIDQISNRFMKFHRRNANSLRKSGSLLESVGMAELWRVLKLFSIIWQVSTKFD